MVSRVFMFGAVLSCCAIGAESAAAQQHGYSQRGYSQRGYSQRGYSQRGYAQSNYGQRGSNHTRGGFNNYGHSGSRHHSNYRPNYGGRNGYGYGYGYPGYAQNYNYGNYTRPYPYHLDYYRMKYGGSYAPYAGNIYGPPLVQQQFVTPQYGVTPYMAPRVAPQSYGSPYYPTPARNYAGAYYW